MTNDKSAEEIVRGLREMLPPQVDYAKLVCAEGFAHGQCYVWEDPEPYIISEAADLIESLQAQLAASQQETRAAVEDLHKMHSLCMDIGGCCPECGDQIDTLMDGACDFCKKSGVNCWVETPGDESKCAAFEWRGEREVGEGERDGD